MNHPNEEQLHDLVDELLAPVDRARVSRHLEVCARCRSAVEEIRELKLAALELARPVEPAPELWNAVRARLHPRVGSEHTERARSPGTRTMGEALAPGTGRKRIRIQEPWMRRGHNTSGPFRKAAAVFVLVLGLTTAGAMLLSRGSGGPEPMQPAPVTVAPDAPAPPASEGPTRVAAHVVGTFDEAYGPTLRELEELLESDRERLLPETLAVIEENLRVIDDAIQEVNSALLADPGFESAASILGNMYDTKVRILRQAVGLAREI